MLFHIPGFVVSGANVSTYSTSKQQTGAAKTLQLVKAPALFKLGALVDFPQKQELHNPYGQLQQAP